MFCTLFFPLFQKVYQPPGHQQVRAIPGFRRHQLLLHAFQNSPFGRDLSTDTLVAGPCLPCSLSHSGGHVSPFLHAVHTPPSSWRAASIPVWGSCPPRLEERLWWELRDQDEVVPEYHRARVHPAGPAPSWARFRPSGSFAPESPTFHLKLSRIGF